MKRINFKKLNIEFEIDNFREIDMRSKIGNAIHVAAETVPMAELARKIYYSDGDVEISDEDYQQMMKIISLSFKIIVVKAIETAANQKEEEV